MSTGSPTVDASEPSRPRAKRPTGRDGRAPLRLIALEIDQVELPRRGPYLVLTSTMRDIAARQNMQASTVSKQCQRLRSLGVLIEDPTGATRRPLIDTARLDALLASAERPSALTTPHPAPLATPPPTAQLATALPAAGGDSRALLTTAIDALGALLEVHPDLVEALAPTITRLALIAAAQSAGDARRAVEEPHGRATARLQGAPEARKSRKGAPQESKEVDLSIPVDQDFSSSLPSSRNGHHVRARDDDKARKAAQGAQGAQPGRSLAQIEALLRPLGAEALHHVYDLRGVRDSFAPYDDEEVSNAVAKMASIPRPGPEQKVGALVNRARDQDRTYFRRLDATTQPDTPDLPEGLWSPTPPTRPGATGEAAQPATSSVADVLQAERERLGEHARQNPGVYGGPDDAGDSERWVTELEADPDREQERRDYDVLVANWLTSGSVAARAAKSLGGGTVDHATRVAYRRATSPQPGNLVGAGR